MADKKISALTGAATPLAGTEVLPIVQSGATVKVAVNDLTAGKTVNGSNFIASSSFGAGGTTPTAGWNTAVFQTQNASFNSNNGQDLRLYQNLYFDGGNYRYITANPGGLMLQYQNETEWFRTTDGSPAAGGVANFTSVLKLTTAGNVNVSNGNVVIGTAGKGIDFSANGGDVLSQYDEGTFTATLTCTTGTITLNSGQDLMQYTRIGRMVYVSGQIVVSAISSPTGILTLGGLPFTINGSLGELAGRGAITVVADGLAITVNNVVGYFVTGGTSATIAKYAAGNPANMAADVTAASSFFINMWYVAA